MDSREAIEYFHLSFCNRLGAKVDRKLFALKGGCNLRFYFNSIRYSEDIDFDVLKISVETLKKNVSAILNEAAFRAVLKNTQKIEIVEWSAPKQTETTQRWKVAIRLESQRPLPTKIEFSRRASEIMGAEVRQVPSHLTAAYQLQPVSLQHYMLPQAIEQKLGALIHRTETQARDVIDLKLLKDQIHAPDFELRLSTEEKEKALDTLMSVSFDDFKSQVWPFLMKEYQGEYDNKSRWNEIQADVVQFVEAAHDRS